MFTGIVQEIGILAEQVERPSARILRIEAPRLSSALAIGDSVAVEGACQTVTSISGSHFTVEAIAETLRVTTLGQLKQGARVNLEPALTPQSSMGGHFVQGHVDGIGTITGRRQEGDAIHFRFSAPEPLVGGMIPKGSVAIDGISLTLGPQIGPDHFEVFIIPHTLQMTTLGGKAVGDPVNLESDVLGKYVLRFLERQSSPKSSIGWDDLRKHGFLDGDDESGF